MPRIFSSESFPKLPRPFVATAGPENVARATYLTCRDVAAQLGVSETTVRRLENRRLLRSRRRGRAHVFDPEEIARYEWARLSSAPTPTGSGEIAARAFELFAVAKDFREVVVALRESPETIRDLHRQYALGGDLILAARVVAEIEALVGKERFASAGGYSAILPRIARCCSAASFRQVRHGSRALHYGRLGGTKGIGCR